MKQIKDFEQAAANIVEIAKKVGVENVESEIRQMLESFYQDGVNDGIKVTWPWELVNEVKEISEPFGMDYENPFGIDEEDLVNDYLRDILFPAIERTVAAFDNDLYEYPTYADFKKVQVGIVPALENLPKVLYVRNVYTGEALNVPFNFDKCLTDCWEGLKAGKKIKEILFEE